MTEPTTDEADADTTDDATDTAVTDIDIEALIEKMDPDPSIRRAIRRHLFRQLLVARGYVRLDDGTLAREGSDASDGDVETE
jgi:hypothetical protein